MAERGLDRRKPGLISSAWSGTGRSSRLEHFFLLTKGGLYDIYYLCQLKIMRAKLSKEIDQMTISENQAAEKEAYLKPETKKYDPISIVAAGSYRSVWNKIQDPGTSECSLYYYTTSYYT